MGKTFVIAELGINHNGDINLAQELIDIAAEHGCDAVKLQKRDIESVYSPEELCSLRESPWGTTFRQQKEGIEFSIEQYRELEIYTQERGLKFIVSCWDTKSIELIEKHCQVDYHKIASAMITDVAFLYKVAETGKPIILSSGMSTEEQIKKAIGICFMRLWAILHCTSTYPTKSEEVNLNYIKTLKDSTNFKVGFSNHTNGILACHAAVAMGAEVIEFHITKDRTMYGSDQAASIENVKNLMEGIRKIEAMLGNGIKKVYDSEIPIMKKLRKK